MDSQGHWIDVFNAQTWQEFLAAGGRVSGFPERRWNTLQQIKPGDRLYCYVAGISRWVGILEVEGAPYRDTAPIWVGADYPARVGVHVVEQLTLETGVPALELRYEMKLFADLKNPNKWSIYFRSSPGKLDPADGRVLEMAIAEAKANPKVRPLPRSVRKPKPPALRASDDLVTIPDDDDDGLQEVDADTSTSDDVGATAHTEMQWLLVKLGGTMGLSVWVARNDRHRSWQGHEFSAQPRVLEALPLQFDPATMTTIELIDVLWLDGNAIVAAFEIESTTSIYSGLLRMADLVAMQPNLNIPLFLVAPDSRRNKVLREVNRPTFARLATPLAEVCRYIPFEGFRAYMDSAEPFLRYLRPEFLQSDELSEACFIDDA